MTDVRAKRRLLWVSKDPVPPNVRHAAAEEWELRATGGAEPLRKQMTMTDVALLRPNGEANNPAALGMLLEELNASSAIGVFLMPPSAEAGRTFLSRHVGAFLCVDDDVAPGDLAVRLAAAAELQPALRKLRSELKAVRKLADTADDAAETYTEEMRLAARLQRDFLPRRLPELPQVRFGVLFRPAGWVSGDIYDVARLDENHVGFYLADAVGHGLPAALLTMFIKKALQTKRISGNSYQIIPPDVSLRELNADICAQNLSSCQFCTVAYCVLDTRSLTLTCARAGHPEPIIIHPDGSAERIEVPGSLLGVFPEERYTPTTVQLTPGDRVILYSDGAETALCPESPQTPEAIVASLCRWAGRPRDDLLLDLTARIERTRDSDRLDDATLIVADML